jgi:hypothetical protein
MRKVSRLAALVVGLAAGTVAMAGDFHYGQSLVCSDCHVIHYSQHHGYNEDGVGIYTPLGGAGPYRHLLRNEINSLCLSCHNNSSFAPDVMGTNSNGYVREAGGLNRDGTAPYFHSTGHTLNSTDVAPGGTWNDPNGLNCIDCHHHHGENPLGNAWRNLRAAPGTAASNSIIDYAYGTNDLSKDVYEIVNGGSVSGHYSINNVWFNEPDPTRSDYATFCKGCHTDFHGAKGGAEVGGESDGTAWTRHPNADSNIGAVGGDHSSLGTYNGRTNKVKVMSPTGVWGPTAPSDVTPSCFSCHKSHGNQNSFGLIYMSGTGLVTEQGDGGTDVKSLCQQCHIQG